MDAVIQLWVSVRKPINILIILIDFKRKILHIWMVSLGCGILSRSLIRKRYNIKYLKLPSRVYRG